MHMYVVYNYDQFHASQHLIAFATRCTHIVHKNSMGWFSQTNVGTYFL